MSSAPAPAATGSPRLLVLRALGLGDLLAAVPALRGLRRAFPGHTLVLATPEPLREAALATGAVDDLLPTSSTDRTVPRLRHWPGPAPEVAVDLHGNGPSSRRALAELSPHRLLAFAGPGPGEAHRTADGCHPAPRWRADEHERDRWCRFLAAHGIPADPADLRLPPPQDPSPAPGAVVVHPGANAAARRWPAERYAAVVRHVRDSGARVVISGGPGDGPAVTQVAALSGVPEGDVLCPLPFPRLSALVAHAALLLSSDTGPAHLAVAHATPSVTLFGPVSPDLWGPPAGGPHRALWHPGPPGDANGARPDPLLLRIDTDEAVRAVSETLRSPYRGGAPKMPSDAR